MGKRACVRTDEGCNQAAGQVARALHAAEQLDGVAAFCKRGDILLVNAADALGAHRLGIRQHAGGDSREDADLAAGVNAVHIRSGILLGIALCLRVRKRVGKAAAFRRHFGENIVGRAVQDAEDAGDLARQKVVCQRAHNRNAAAHAGFKRIGHAVCLGNLQKLFAEGGDDLLVGGDHALARRKCGFRIVIGRMCAPHHFGDERHLGVAQNDGKVVHDLACKRRARKIAQIEDVFDLNATAEAGYQQVAVAFKQVERASADDAETEKGDVSHGFSFLFAECVHIARDRV